MTRRAASVLALAVVPVLGLTLAGCGGSTVDGSGRDVGSVRPDGTRVDSGQVSLAPPTPVAPSPPVPSSSSSAPTGPELQADPPLPPGGARTTADQPSSGITYYSVPVSFAAARAFYAREIPALGLSLGSPVISRGLKHEVLSYHYIVSAPVQVVGGAHGTLSIDRFFNRAFLPANRTVVEFALS